VCSSLFENHSRFSFRTYKEFNNDNIMAANDVAMRAAYQRLGFTVAAATFLTEKQDQNDLDELLLLTDTVRRPGATIAGPTPAGGGVAVQVNNPGSSVSLRAENNLKLACFYLKHRYRVSRVVLPVEITEGSHWIAPLGGEV
jgi:hypothetical protein